MYTAPNRKYVEENTSKCGEHELTDCWVDDEYFNASDFNNDLDGINPAIAYWNDTLFVIGRTQIHYRKYHILNQTDRNNINVSKCCVVVI